MKKLRLLAAALGSALLLSGCSIWSIFGGNRNKEQGPKYSGHYLVDLYEPEKLSQYGCTVVKLDTEYDYLDGEKHYKGYELNTNVQGVDLLRHANECEILYKIDSDKYKSLCFLAGTVENRLNSWRIGDSCALSVSLDGVRAYEEMYYAIQAPKYVSIDITGKTEIKFYVDQNYYMRCLGVFEITLWEDANHSIEEKKAPAKEEEDFLDNSYYVYGEQDDSDFTGGYVILDKAERTMKINGEVIKKGFALHPSSSRLEIHMNTWGRYKYMHFNLGHIDDASKDGAILVEICVDRVSKLVTRIDDSDLPMDITVPLNGGKIVSILAKGDPEDDTRTDISSFGFFGMYNIIGSPNETFPDSGEGKKYDGSYKLISQVAQPYNFVNNFAKSESLLLGKTAYNGVQIGGVIYSEGMILKSIYNIMTTTTEQMPAKAEFDLKKAFSYLTFKVGRKDKTALARDTLNIYLDGTLKDSYDLNTIASIQDFTISVSGKRTLTFELVGAADTYRGTYGIVDIGVHTDKVRELPFDHVPNGKKAAKDSYESGTVVHLMDDLVCYESFSGMNEQDLYTDDRTDECEYIKNSGRTFQVAGQAYDHGFLLQSVKRYSLGGSGGIGMVLSGFYFGVFAGSDIQCASVVAFNFRGKFSTLSFSAGAIDGTTGAKAEKLDIIGDDKVIYNALLQPNDSRRFEVDVHEVNNLIFFLEYTNTSSAPFAFYNVQAAV